MQLHIETFLGSTRIMWINPSLAHDQIIVKNAMENQDYAPYCGRCSGLHRMKKIATLLWKHGCGAIHDERQCLVEPNQGKEGRADAV